MANSKGDFVFKATASDLKLMPGDYVVTIALAENNTTIDIKEECLGFTVVPNDVYGTGRIPKGNLYVYSDAKWELNQK